MNVCTYTYRHICKWKLHKSWHIRSICGSTPMDSSPWQPRNMRDLGFGAWLRTFGETPTLRAATESSANPKGPCTYIVSTLAAKYLKKELLDGPSIYTELGTLDIYIYTHNPKPQTLNPKIIYTIWAHGPVEKSKMSTEKQQQRLKASGFVDALVLAALPEADGVGFRL